MRRIEKDYEWWERLFRHYHRCFTGTKREAKYSLEQIIPMENKIGLTFPATAARLPYFLSRLESKAIIIKDGQELSFGYEAGGEYVKSIYRIASCR
jgi:hypothetical protein